MWVRFRETGEVCTSVLFISVCVVLLVRVATLKGHPYPNQLVIGHSLFEVCG